MKRIPITLWLVILPAIATFSLAASAAAQTVVVGTGNPDIDVPAVQAAVDQGGDVVLKGHFSFDRSPTIPTTPGSPQRWSWCRRQSPSLVHERARPMTVSSRVLTRERFRSMSRLRERRSPFRGCALSDRRGLRSVCMQLADWVIASCKIEGAVPVNHGSAGIAIATSSGLLGSPPTLMNPGKPENVSGTLFIVNNVIDVAGGTALDHTLGVLLFSVGVPSAQVDVHISGNTVMNTTDRSINLYQIAGRAHIERNVITTSTIVGNANVVFGRGTDVIHVTGTGSYLVAGNSVHSLWAAATGIRVQGQAAEWPIKGAVVVDNDVNMDAPEGTVFDANSAAIDVRGNVQDNVILNNRIRGRARAALVVAINQPSMVATNNHFILNRLAHFEASFADVFVGVGVMNTLIVGQGTVDDQGVGTDVVPVADRGDDKDHR